MSKLVVAPPSTRKATAAQAWLRALELTASIPRHRSRVLSTVADEMASRFGQMPALLSDRECFTYGQLAQRMHQYARWALAQGLEKGDVVGLLMPNRPEYVAIWLGITSVGGVVALLNTSLVGASLVHCIHAASPKHLIVSAECLETWLSAPTPGPEAPVIWTHGADLNSLARIDLDVETYASEPLNEREQRPLSIEECALYIYTSGTTGMPKAALVSHARVMQWSHWFAGMMDVQPEDRIYNCLPMYHSVGGVQTPGAAIVGGASLVIRERFSSKEFWKDIARWDCTIFQYIGELCRYLLQAPALPSPEHRIRLACGNGLASDVWTRFEEKFGIPQILEFYASTEGGVSLFNVEAKCGSIGRVPPYLVHRFSPALVRVDHETGEPLRNRDGFCVRCQVNEVGEALGKFREDQASVGSRFEGYLDKTATEKKILHGVFEPNDHWLRTGDLMRKDEQGFFYFVDRLGDTFRWKGENVSTLEVAAAICDFPGVAHAIAYGVAVPATDGRAGMAAVVAAVELDLPALRRHLQARLPVYARPIFLRIRHSIDLTGTFKYAKGELAQQSYNPAASADALYFGSAALDAFTPLDDALYQHIQSGQIHL